MHADDIHIPMCGDYFGLRGKKGNDVSLHKKNNKSNETFSTECKWPLLF